MPSLGHSDIGQEISFVLLSFFRTGWVIYITDDISNRLDKSLTNKKIRAIECWIRTREITDVELISFKSCAESQSAPMYE